MSGKLRRLAQRAKNAAQTCRLLAIAAALDGASREDAAKIGGSIRYNDQGPDGLINIPSPGPPAKLDAEHKVFRSRIVDEGPIPAVHGVVRWRACDLIMLLHEGFGFSVSDDTIYRALEDLNVSHVSARPNAYRQVAEAMETFKKTLPYALRKSARNPRRAPRGVVPGPCGCRRPVRPRSHDGSARSRRPQAYRAHEPDQTQCRLPRAPGDARRHAWSEAGCEDEACRHRGVQKIALDNPEV